MVIEALLNIVFGVVRTLLLALPDITWSCDEGLMASFIDLIRIILYLFPMGTVTIIIGLVIAMNVYKIVISLIKTIWDLIPFV